MMLSVLTNYIIILNKPQLIQLVHIFVLYFLILLLLLNFHLMQLWLNRLNY